MCIYVGVFVIVFGPWINEAGVNKAGLNVALLLLVEGEKPGGGSMPCSISMARWMRALLSQSSIG